MTAPTLRVKVSDLSDPPLPEPGYHRATVHSVRLRSSASGNETIQVVFHLPEEEPECDRVCDYFVLEGASARAVAISRRRLLDLLRACGECPQEDQEIPLRDLEGRELEVRISHQSYEGVLRPRVTGYREAL
jgi:hypothetical protein